MKAKTKVRPLAADEDGIEWYSRAEVSKRGARAAYAAQTTGRRGWSWHYRVTPAFMCEDVNYEGDEGPYFWPCEHDHLEAIPVWEVEELWFSPGPVRRRLRAWCPRWNWGRRGVALWGFHRKRKARWFDRLILGRDVDTLYQEFTAAGYTNDRGTVVHG